MKSSYRTSYKLPSSRTSREASSPRYMVPRQLKYTRPGVRCEVAGMPGWHKKIAIFAKWRESSFVGRIPDGQQPGSVRMRRRLDGQPLPVPIGQRAVKVYQSAGPSPAFIFRYVLHSKEFDFGRGSLGKAMAHLNCTARIHLPAAGPIRD